MRPCRALAMATEAPSPLMPHLQARGFPEFVSHTATNMRELPT
jgi:hypothetical protein